MPASTIKSSGIKKAARTNKGAKPTKAAKQKVLAKVAEKPPAPVVLIGQFTRTKRFCMNVLERQLIPEFPDKIKKDQIRYSKEAIQLLRMFNQDLLIKEFRKQAILNRMQNKQTVSVLDVHTQRMIAMNIVDTATLLSETPIACALLGSIMRDSFYTCEISPQRSPCTEVIDLFKTSLSVLGDDVQNHLNRFVEIAIAEINA